MRKLILTTLLVVLSSPTFAQWQTPDHSSPIGRGNTPPKTGFKSFGPCAAGVPHVGAGATSDPACAAETLSPLFSMGAGIVAKTGAGAYSARTLTAPAAGFTITNPAGTAGNPTFALANDLAALEALSGTGYPKRTGTDTWTQLAASGILDDISTSNGAILCRSGGTWSVIAAAASGVLTAGGTTVCPTYSAGISTATQADQETATSTTLAVTPGRQQFHPSAAKAQCTFNGTTVGGPNPCLATPFNVSGVSRVSAGVYNVNFTISFSTGEYPCVVTTSRTGGATGFATLDQSVSTGSALRVNTFNSVFASTDMDRVNVVCFGDQ